MNNVNSDLFDDGCTILKVSGMVNIKHFDEHGNLLNEIDTPNAVVETGLVFIAQRVGSLVPPSQMTHMGLGTGTADNTGSPPTNTTLSNQVGSRQTIDITPLGTNERTITYNANFGTGTGTVGAITEAGIFSAATGGTMLARTKFNVINKGENDSLAVTWKITFS